MTKWIHIVLIGMSCAVVQAASPYREPISFTYTNDVGPNRSVYLVGNHVDIGSWNPFEAVRLSWTPGNVWSGTVAVQAGTALEYKFIARVNSQAQHCVESNVVWQAGPNLERTVPAQPAAPYTGKTIYYHTSWTNAFILYKVGTNFVSSPPMEQIGEGRSEGEFLYRITGIGEEGEGLEFVPNGYLGGVQYWDNAPYPGYGDNNYYTPLDVFYLQDGHIFNYKPPPSVSASQLISTNVASTVSEIPGRSVSILLPRGYAENTWKRYPVLYMHDQQNLFGGGWQVDSTVPREISQGRIREVIIVAMPHAGVDRHKEYGPPGDVILGDPGIGDKHLEFVVHNVRPTIDTHFRTLNDPYNTLIAGSSLGGLISTYMGLEGGGVFGKVGAFSPSYVYATNFVSRIAINDTKGLVRWYIDGGTGEGSGIWQIWTVYDHILRDGYAQNADLKFVVECGTEHNEAAWAGRLPGALHYLLNLWDEANLLVHDVSPLEIDSPTMDVNSFVIDYEAYHGWQYRLERATSLIAPLWTAVATTAVERLPWQPRALADTNLVDRAVYRLLAESPAVITP